MKNTFYILTALVLLMVACGRPSGNAPLSAELQRAEDLMYPHPDSALHILQAMTPPEDELNHATWALLLTQAKYKCFVDQSDSLVNIAHDYFASSNNPERNALALYLKGGLLYDNRQYDEALNYYLEADKEVEKLSNDTLGFLIDSHICMIYAYQKLYDYAIEYAWKSNEHAIQSNDPNYLVLSYIRIARANADVDIDESITCYEKAISIAEHNGILNLKATALVEIAGRYIVPSKKDYERALFAIKEAMKIKQTDQTYVVLGYIYIERKTI